MPAHKKSFLFKPVRPRVPSAKSRMEATPGLAEREMAWYKSRPGELRPAAKRRRPREVYRWPPKERDVSTIHTHPVSPRQSSRSGLSFPSSHDIGAMISEIYHTNLRNWHVATVDRRGGVIGYVSIYAPPKFVRFIRGEHAAVQRLVDAFNSRRKQVIVPDTLAQKKVRMKKLVEAGMRIRYTPMPGYVFEKGFFKKKRKG